MKIAECAGKFITFEGIEGSGKTTNISFVADYLRGNKINVLVTREPGGTPMGEQIRGVLLATQSEVVTPITEMLLLFAARSQHLHNVIKPALAAGKCVLCDRFTDATYAYQGGGRGIAFADIAALENMVQPELRPDITIVLDVSVEVSLQRIQKRHNLDRIEQETKDFFTRVRQVYLARAASFPEKYKIIDTTVALAEVQQELANLFLL